MSDQPALDPCELVCHCMAVDRGTIAAAIAAGARSVEDLQRRTTACCGCGSCRWDLEALLRAAALGRGDHGPPAA